MSKIIPPLLSTSPPPIAGVADESDDEFGDFTVASTDIPDGCDSLSLSTHIDIKTVEKDFQDRRKIGDNLGLGNDLDYSTSKIKVTNVTSKFSNFQYFSDVPPDDDDVDDNIDSSQKVFSDVTNDIHAVNKFATRDLDNSSINKERLNQELSANVEIVVPSHNLYSAISNPHEVDDAPDDHVDINQEIFSDNINNTHTVRDVDDSNTSNETHLIEDLANDIAAINLSQNFCSVISEPDDTDSSLSYQVSRQHVDSEATCDCTDVVLREPCEDVSIDSSITISEASNQTEKVHTSVVEKQDSQLPDDDFGDFGCFSSMKDCSSVVDTEPKSTKNVTEQFDDFGDFENQVFQEDEFGDFNNYSLQPSDALVTFTDLQDLKSIIVEIFPIVDKESSDDYKEQNFTVNDFVFNQIKDVTETNALSYQWQKSKSQHFLLKSLNIDMRNILYGPRWNESMPRYAATLGFTPLEPIKTELPSPTVVEPTVPVSPNQASVSETPVQANNDIPSAQFDWIGSGLENPLEITPMEPEKKDLDTRPYVSVLTPTSNSKFKFPSVGPDSDSVKSLHLNENEVTSVDDEFEDFTSYQRSDKVEKVSSTWSDKTIPLRETHIAIQDNEDIPRTSDEPGWLKPTILTPVLSRREEPNTFFTNDDLVDWLQYQKDQRSTHRDSEINLSAISAKEESDNDINNKLPTEISNVKEDKHTFMEASSQNIHTTVFQSPEQLNSAFGKIDISRLTLVETQVVNSLPHPETVSNTIEASEHNYSDDEFTDFQSSDAPVLPQTTLAHEPLHTPTPLMPAILQPIKVAPTSTVIDWPDPGITDEELKRFESFYQPTNKQDDVGDEDEWCDFVSNQAPIELNSVKQPSQLKESISITEQQISSKLPRNGIHTSNKNDAMDDEWSDFVSGPPVIPNGIHMPTQKINFDFSRPPQFTSWTSNITPNVITNPVAFETFQNRSVAPQIDLLKNRSSVKKPSNVVLQPKRNTIPSISSIPNLEFIVPKSHTWKK